MMFVVKRTWIEKMVKVPSIEQSWSNATKLNKGQKFHSEACRNAEFCSKFSKMF